MLIRFSSSSSLFLGLVLLAALLVGPTSSHGDGEDCTRGMLYVSEKNSTAIHVYDLNGNLMKENGLEETNTISSAEIRGGPGQALHATESGLYIMSTFWGSEEADYQDGHVNFINTGATVEDHGDHSHPTVSGDPTVLSNVYLACGPTWHAAEHGGYIALYCDGSFDKGVNSTYYILEEASLADDPVDPFLLTASLEGSHHGIAIPVNSNRVLHSLATPERVNRLNTSESLPYAFQVVDYDKNLVLRLANLSDPSAHCAAYHGSAAIDNVFFFCCEDKVLAIELDEASQNFSSRVLTFPDTISSAHRCGSVHARGGTTGSYVVSDYADWDADRYAPHLLAFPRDATELSDADVLVLGEEGQCQFELEQSQAEHLVVLLPNGTVQAYTYGRPDGWALVGQAVLMGISECSDATLTLGYGQAFVSVSDAKILYSLDLTHLEHGGEIEVSSTTVPYTPSYLAVAAVPKGTACIAMDDHRSDVSGGGESSGSNRIKLSVGAFLATLLTYALY
jgi:hypothetical protein